MKKFVPEKYFSTISWWTQIFQSQCIKTASIHLLSRFSHLSSSGCQNFSKSVLQEYLAASWALQCNIFTVLSWFIYFEQIPFLACDRLVIIRNYPWCLLIRSGCSRGKGRWCCHIIFFWEIYVLVIIRCNTQGCVRIQLFTLPYQMKKAN